jgi:hypothetical protein
MLMKRGATLNGHLGPESLQSAHAGYQHFLTRQKLYGHMDTALDTLDTDAYKEQTNYVAALTSYRCARLLGSYAALIPDSVSLVTEPSSLVAQKSPVHDSNQLFETVTPDQLDHHKADYKVYRRNLMLGALASVGGFAVPIVEKPIHPRDALASARLKALGKTTPIGLHYDPIWHQDQSYNDWIQQEKRTRRYKQKPKRLKKLLTYFSGSQQTSINIQMHTPEASALIYGIQRKIGILALAASVAMVPYLKNVLDVSHERAQSHSSVSEVYKAKDEYNRHRAIVHFAGLSGVDGYGAAHALPVYSEHANVWAMRYINSGSDSIEFLNYEDMADTIIKKALNDDISEINGSGDSMGGLVEVRVFKMIIKKIIAEKLPLRVHYLILNCSPIGLDSVRPDKLSAGAKAKAILSVFPLAEDSEYLRYMGEIYAQKDRVFTALDQPDLTSSLFHAAIAAAEIYNEKITSPDGASTRLLLAQDEALSSIDPEEELADIADMLGNETPYIVDISPTNPESDQTTNNPVAISNLIAIGEKNNLTILPERFDGITHANPGFRPVEYDKGMRDKLFPAIGKQDYLRAIQKSREQFTETIEHQSGITSMSKTIETELEKIAQPALQPITSTTSKPSPNG